MRSSSPPAPPTESRSGKIPLEGTYVFFYTEVARLHPCSGFLYVPEGGSPTTFTNAGGYRLLTATAMEENWYGVEFYRGVR
jgi:hypothetical protein